MIDNASPPFAMPRARRIALTVTAITLAISLFWVFISVRLVDSILEGQPNSVIWHALLDCSFAIAASTIVYWLVHRSVSQVEQSEQALRKIETALRENEERLRGLYEQVQLELLERSRVQGELRQSEERYRTLIENQGEGICLVDEHECLTFANRAANEIFGQPAGGLAGHNLNEFLAAEEFAVIRRQTEVRRSGETSTYEIPIIRSDGQVRTLLVTARPRYDEAGAFLGAFSIFRDITERKQAEEELARTRADLERRNQQLTQILEAGNSLRMNLDLDVILGEIVHGAHRSLGFRVIVLNTVEEESGRMYIHAHAGLDEAGRQALEGATYDWNQMLKLMREEFRIGRAYFIPAGAIDWQRELSGPTYDPDLPIRDEADAWHPEDVLFIPIEMRDGSIAGTISLDVPTDGKRPTLDTLRPLEVFVNQAAIAIENARLFEAERQRRKEIEAAYQASIGLTTSLDLRQVLQSILNAALSLVQAQDAHIFLYDGEMLQFGAALSRAGVMQQPFAQPRRDGLTYTVARSKQAISVEDSSQHPLFADVPASWGTFAIAGLPLIFEAKVVGVMTVGYSAPRRIGESERRLLDLLATQAAVAVQNARLHEQVQHYAEILEQRVAERTVQLEHQRQHLQAILDSAGEGIQIMDPQGKIEYINPAAEYMTGFAATEVCGHVTRMWANDLNPPVAMQELRVNLAHGQAWQGEIIDRRKDGTLYDSALTITPVKDAQAHITGFVAVLRDITHLKELDRLKDQFVSRIGHELRTPVANIVLYVELLERSKLDKQGEYFQTLRREADRLRRLIDGFLEISQLDARTVPIHVSAVDLNHLTYDLLRDRWGMAEGRDLTVESHFDPFLDGPVINTDRTLIAQAIANLLDNAIYYTPRAGTITVTTAVREDAQQTWHSLEVYNTGPGISPEEIAHVCERFYRGEAARDYKVPGAGLGLSIAQVIVQRLGGRLTVESLPAAGVTFTVWLK